MEGRQEYEESAHLVKAGLEELEALRGVLTVEYEVLFDLVYIEEHLDTAVQITRVSQILEALILVVFNFLHTLGLGTDCFIRLATLLK